MSTELATNHEVGVYDRPKFFQPEHKENPTEQQSVTMRVVTYTSQTTEYGTRAIVIGEELGTGIVWSRMLTGTVLTREFGEQQPMPGEVVRITYEGQGIVQKGKYQGREFARWDVQVMRGVQVPNFAALAADQDADAELRPVDATPRIAAAGYIDADIPADVEDLPEPPAALADVAATHFGEDIPF